MVGERTVFVLNAIDFTVLESCYHRQVTVATHCYLVLSGFRTNLLHEEILLARSLMRPLAAATGILS